MGFLGFLIHRIGWWKKNRPPTNLMAKTMVSGEDFPVNTNPLTNGIQYDIFCWMFGWETHQPITIQVSWNRGNPPSCGRFHWGICRMMINQWIYNGVTAPLFSDKPIFETPWGITTGITWVWYFFRGFDLKGKQVMVWFFAMSFCQSSSKFIPLGTSAHVLNVLMYPRFGTDCIPMFKHFPKS